jgi:hypothetical protein
MQINTQTWPPVQGNLPRGSGQSNPLSCHHGMLLTSQTALKLAKV